MLSQGAAARGAALVFSAASSREFSAGDVLGTMSHRKKRQDVTNRTRTAGARSPAERLEPGRAPMRPKGLEHREPSRIIGGLVRIISGILTVALVGMVVVGGIVLTVYSQYENPGPLETARTIVIPKGEGRIAIAERLEREGVIANRWTFIGGHLMQSFLSGKKSTELKAGEYQLAEHASMREVLETLAEGKSILYKTTIPEGLTSAQIVERIKADPNLTGDVVVVPDEGTLLADTYHFSKGTSRQDVIDRMRSAMEALLAELWEKRQQDTPLRSAGELVTFASIVEKETGRADERERVSAVFHNRLKKGMRLQSDPTIIYGIVGGQGSLGRSITRDDIATKTAYNTYQINGLPPGPICNPGRASLEASLNPAKTSDLYFVADGSGGHAFSATLKDHNSAVQKWREVEKKARTAAGEAEPDPDVAPVPASDGAATSAPPAAASATATKAAAIPLPTRKPKKQQ